MSTIINDDQGQWLRLDSFDIVDDWSSSEFFKPPSSTVRLYWGFSRSDFDSNNFIIPNAAIRLRFDSIGVPITRTRQIIIWTKKHVELFNWSQLRHIDTTNLDPNETTIEAKRWYNRKSRFGASGVLPITLRVDFLIPQ